MVYASNELANLDQSGLGSAPLSSCQVGSYYKVNAAGISNFPPQVTKLNVYLNTTVLVRQPIEDFTLKLTSGNGQTTQSTMTMNISPPPGIPFDITAFINIPGQKQENFILQMILSNANQDLLCYQMTFALWNVS